MKYTEEQIRSAFMATFAGAGEMWFPYEGVGVGGGVHEVDTEEEGAEYKWQEFLTHLRGKEAKR